MKRYIVVPGMGGSRLYCVCSGKKRLIYPVIGALSKHFYSAACLTVTAPLKSFCSVSIYSKLVKRLGGEKFCDFFPYDWRKSPLAVSKELYGFLAESNARYSLIGHSSGGFIVRILIEYLKYPRSKVDRIYLCASPFYGSPRKYLYTYEDVVIRKLRQPGHKIELKQLFLVKKKDVDRIFHTYRESIVYFLPSHFFNQHDDDTLSSLLNMSNTIIYVARQIHSTLARFDFQEYHFYYNISQKYTLKYPVPYNGLATDYYNMVPLAQRIQYRVKDNKYVARQKLLTDSLVIPSFDFPANSVVILDTTYLSHAFVMNSKFLADLITRA